MLRRLREKKVVSLNMKLRIALVLTYAFVCAVVPAPAQSADPVRLERAHAHNDYDHQRPLFEALENGFKSVEADIYLVANQLFIGHDYPDPTRTLESLYLDPLLQRVRANGGTVYPGDPNYLTLPVDVKTEASSTYAELDRHLQPYASMLTSFTPQGVEPGAVMIIVSGNRDGAAMRAQQLRYAAYDGRLSDLGKEDPNTFIPLISDNWTNVFTWNGTGPMPDQQRQQLNYIVSTAHANGQRVRFWNTPDAPGAQRDAVWREELRARVDFFNTDQLSDLRAFLLSNDPNPSKPYVNWFNDFVPPILALPPDLTVEATGPDGAVVTYSGSAYDNVDGDVPVSFSPAPGSTFPLGATTVRAAATDAAGNTATGTFTVRVRDTTAPAVQSLTASPNVLWGPNHGMAGVTLGAAVSDVVDAAPVTRIVAVSSTEAQTGLWPGDIGPDWEITGALTVKLRAERAGEGPGRTYTITVESRDASGNASTRTVTVLVPHDMKF
jgi:hypothetical protein